MDLETRAEAGRDVVADAIDIGERPLGSLGVREFDSKNVNHGGRRLSETDIKIPSLARAEPHSYWHHQGVVMSKPEDILAKQRLQMRQQFEIQKKNLISETEKARPSANRFVVQDDSVEESLKHSTVGLVQLEVFQQKRKELEDLKAREAARSSALKDDKKKKKRKKSAKATLSFAMDDEGDPDDSSSSSTPAPTAPPDDEPPAKRAKFGKNPNVDTSFLPDREREESERLERERLRQEWLERQEDIKAEEIEVVYSYWDGSGHRKSVMCKKGDDIGKLLERCRAQNPELRGVSVDNLMYVKEDLIIPHHYTFYDFIINKARGKSGPLFNFDAHEDVRLLADATKEKDESHAGKVVERSYYQRNKHIFPASRWEVFDPEVNYGEYRIA